MLIIYLIYQKLFWNWKYPKFYISLNSLKERTGYKWWLLLFWGSFWASISESWHAWRRIAYCLSMRHNWLSENAVVTDSSLDFIIQEQYISNLEMLHFPVLLLSDTDLKYFVLALWIWQSVKEMGHSEKKEKCLFLRDTAWILLKRQSSKVALLNKDCKYLYWFDSNYGFHHWHLIYYMYLHSKVTYTNDE